MSDTPRVWNKRDPNTPRDGVYVGRPTKWGNPFIVRRDGDRDYVISCYRAWLEGRWHRVDGRKPPKTSEIKSELKGRDLVCWCAPAPCHADVLLTVANEGG